MVQSPKSGVDPEHEIDREGSQEPGQDVHPNLLGPPGVEAGSGQEQDGQQRRAAADEAPPQGVDQGHGEEAEDQGEVAHGELALADQPYPGPEGPEVEGRVDVAGRPEGHGGESLAGRPHGQPLVPPDVLVPQLVGPQGEGQEENGHQAGESQPGL